ncbi:hypothetical protein FUAX_25040 [Fulvitalea axinellae]|uniref:Uncharacterized protein n=1 Tax=Fulvitalea axinellae TaxID=1182444 RepID=A0AAU9CXA7_9BACT|nr:hypothetical protein FUAX_25040 [Fulvitalea axinellae]
MQTSALHFEQRVSGSDVRSALTLHPELHTTLTTLIGEMLREKREILPEALKNLGLKEADINLALLSRNPREELVALSIKNSTLQHIITDTEERCIFS